MNDIRDLEEALTRHEFLAPPPDGLIEGAYRGARRVRRRRLAAAGLGVAAVVAAGSITPGMVSDPGDSGPDRVAGPATSGSSTLPAAPAVTIGLAANSGLFVLNRGFEGARTFATMRSETSAADWGGRVTVQAASTVDTARLLAGEPLTVRGHPAYYVDRFPVGTSRFPAFSTVPDAPEASPREVLAPVVAWPDAAGNWVIVSASRDRAGLERLAAAVEITPGGVVRTPYRLGVRPAGISPVAHESSDVTGSRNSRLILGVPGDPVPDSGVLPTDVDAALTILVAPRDLYLDDHAAALGAPTPIAGHDTRYVTTSGNGVTVAPNGSLLLANVGSCSYTLSVGDRNKVTYDDLKRLIETTDFKDCAEPATWVGPLS